MKVTTRELFGFSFYDCCLSELLEVLENKIEEKEKVQVVTANPEILARGFQEEEFNQVLKEAEIVVADGIGVVMASRFLGEALSHRLPGVEIGEALMVRGEEKGWRFYFLGGKEEVVEKAVKELKVKYPRLDVGGFHHGYFGEDEEIIEDINRVNPHILLVGLGSPRQECWIQGNRERINALVMMGVGGSFDVWSGTKKRAPRWMRKLNLEWAYRIICEPQRLRRVVPAFFNFAQLVWKEKRGQMV
ncbi:MAG TPA: WecB/TagA/CpsF family glycosyltransferase [Candidatus Atribacteria bacterium]|nr:WecB/TagA/CpsF family glycosyltransferase [Candidatus Atribacteria bacterium]